MVSFPVNLFNDRVYKDVFEAVVRELRYERFTTRFVDACIWWEECVIAGTWRPLRAGLLEASEIRCPKDRT